MSGPLRIRHAVPQDAAALAAFAGTAFRDTYRDIDDPDDVAAHVAEHFTPPAVEQVIRDPASTTLLGEVDGTLAGYAILRHKPPPACVTGPDPIELARFYLGQAFIGRGHGAALMRAVHREAALQQRRTVWLGVYDRNLRAINFYERFDFRKVGGTEFLFAGKIVIDPIYATAVRDE